MVFFCGEIRISDCSKRGDLCHDIRKDTDDDSSGVRSLTCRSCLVDQDAVKRISNLPALVVLDLGGCCVEKKELELLLRLMATPRGKEARPTSLVRTLRLYDLKQLDDAAVCKAADVGRIIECNVLNVSNTNVSDLSAVARAFPSLTELFARDTRPAPSGVEAALRSLPLEKLSLGRVSVAQMAPHLLDAMKIRMLKRTPTPLHVCLRGSLIDASVLELLKFARKHSRHMSVSHDLLESSESIVADKLDVFQVVVCLQDGRKLTVNVTNLSCMTTVKAVAEEAITNLNATCLAIQQQIKNKNAKERQSVFSHAFREMAGTATTYTVGMCCIYEVNKASGEETFVPDGAVDTCLIGRNLGTHRLLLRVEAEREA